MPRLVDDRMLGQWRALDALYVLKKLGCYVKLDVSFHPLKVKRTERYQVNVNGQDWELVLTGPKFWDTRANKGGGGAVDLTMHLLNLDFKGASRLLGTVLSDAPLPIVSIQPPHCSGQSNLRKCAGPKHGMA